MNYTEKKNYSIATRLRFALLLMAKWVHSRAFQLWQPTGGKKRIRINRSYY